MFLSYFEAASRHKLRAVAEYGDHIDAFLRTQSAQREASFTAERHDDPESEPEFDDSFSADGMYHRLFWNSYVVVLVSLLEDRLRDAWRGLARPQTLKEPFRMPLSQLKTRLSQKLPSLNPPDDHLSADIDFIVHIRNQITHADGDDVGLGPEARALLACYSALNTSGEDEVQCNVAFCTFARERVTAYIERLILLLPPEAKR